MESLSFVFAVFFTLSGSLGIPMGIPPGPEDPMMSRLAPDDCLVYASWSGVAEIDGDSNPTEKWLSQPKASKMISKLRKAYRGFLLQQSDQTGDPVLKLASKLMIEAVDTASVQPAAFYLDEIKIEEQIIQPHGAFVIKLGEREDVVTKLLDELFAELDTLKNTAAHHAFEPVEIGGQKVLKIYSGPSGVPVHVVVRDGYFVMGLGTGSLEQVAKNMATEAPKWLTQLRQRLKVDRVSSVAYINEKIYKEFHVSRFGNFWMWDFEWTKGLQSIGWVAGVDEHGFLCRAELVEDGLEQSELLGLIDLDPIPKKFLSEIPADQTLAIATRISTKKILELVRDSMRGADQKKMLDESLAKFQKLSGVSLEKDLLASVGDFVSVYYDLKLDGFYRGWVVSIRIKDEMSFPEYLFQINQGVENWAEDLPGVEFKTRKVGEYEIQYLDTERSYNKIAWAVVHDQWYFAAVPDDIEKHLKQYSKHREKLGAEKAPEVGAAGVGPRSYLDDPLVAEIFEFGDKSGLGNPLTISHIDLPDIIREFGPFIGMLVEPIHSGFDFRWNDIPPVDELTNEVTPSFMAIFKSDSDNVKGYQLYQRQTYPGAPPVVTAAAAGIVTFSTQFGTATTKKRMHEIGKAHLAFEKKNGRLCAPYSTGPAGERLLSWRVHLLPFLGHQELYDEFRLNEPWDSVHNASLTAKMPMVYQSSTSPFKEGKTTFLLPTAPGALFNRVAPNSQISPVGISDAVIKDPRSEVLMLMEVNPEYFAVTWTQPADFDKSGKEFRMQAARPGMGSKVNCLMSDGKLRSFHYWSAKTFDQIMNCSDGEKVTFPEQSLFGW